MRFKWKQGMSAVAAAACFAMALTPVSAAGTQGNEVIPSWASAEIAAWKELGLLKGNEKGYVLPNDAVKKTEFVAFVNRVFHYVQESSQTFKDVPAGAWYASDINKAVAAGLIVGEGNGKVSPLEILTREKAALILYKAFQVPAAADSSAKFADDAQISSWAKEAVYAMKEAGYVAGTPDGGFQPKKALTRAEAVKMIHNAMGMLVADGNAHSDLSGKNMVVNTAGGKLSNVTLSGNLYITPGVGDGDLTLDNVKVGGTIYVNGGGAHTVTLLNSTAGGISINKPNSPLRVLLRGSTAIPAVLLISGGQVDNETSNPIGTLNIDGGSNRNVGVSGPVNQLNMNANVNLNIGSGQIANFTVSPQASGGTVGLGSGARIDSFTANGGVGVTGEGSIGSAIINAEGVNLGMRPTQLTVNAPQATIAGQVVKKGETGTPPVVGGGSGGPTIPATALYTYDEALSKLGSSKAEGYVKQYIGFLKDPTYDPDKANPDVDMPELTNAKTFVNYQFDVKPSIFPSMRGVNTSVLNASRTYLWIGTDVGVTKINLSNNNEMASYNKDNGQLVDNKVLLLISDGGTGVFAITENGVSHIYQ